MRILSAKVHYFGSYEHLIVPCNLLGLTLVSGPTGSGKSTLCDVIPWVLFGRTSKGGGVDEVRSWSSDEDTVGTVIVKVDTHQYTIVRKRGSTNDLFYSDSQGRILRGKDLKDTQTKINQLLGVTVEHYLLGAYLHEFTQSSMFFTSSSKIRKQTMDQLADLSFTNDLSNEITEIKKLIKKDLILAEALLSLLKSNGIPGADKTLANLESESFRWESAQCQKINDYKKLINNPPRSAAETQFQEQKTRLESAIEDLASQVIDYDHFTRLKNQLDNKYTHLKDDTCVHCGAFKNNTERLLITKQRHELEVAESNNNSKIGRLTQYQKQLENHLLSPPGADLVNPYIHLLLKATEERNPFKDLLEDAKNEKQRFMNEHEVQSKLVLSLKQDISDLETLYDILATLRTNILSSTINRLESTVNLLLSDHFDAELSVSFKLEDGDRLEVEIRKDSNQAVFTQLSKGQRQLLKLCLGLAIMRVSTDVSGLSFNLAFIDEALDGLDEDFKLKAFRMLEAESRYDAIFLVDHSESLKVLANNQMHVRLVNGTSKVEVDVE